MHKCKINSKYNFYMYLCSTATALTNTWDLANSTTLYATLFSSAREYAIRPDSWFRHIWSWWQIITSQQRPFNGLCYIITSQQRQFTIPWFKKPEVNGKLLGECFCIDAHMDALMYYICTDERTIWTHLAPSVEWTALKRCNKVRWPFQQQSRVDQV